MLTVSDKKSKARKKEKETGKNSRKRSRKFFVIIAVCAAAAAAGITIFLLLTRIDQPVYSIGYVIKAFPEEGCLNVDVSIDISRLSRDRTILLYKGLMTEQTIDFTGCSDGSGSELPFTDSPDLISIGPIDKNAGQVSFKYNAYIGSLNEEEIYYGMPLYARGCLIDDLITFSGENAIMIPFLDPKSFDSIEKYIRSVSFEFIVPDGLSPIIPYQPPVDGQLSFIVDKPDWDFFNRISKSAFCFGHFERYDYNGYFGDAAVYVDKAAAIELSQHTLEAMTGFLGYYTDIFGGPPGDDVPLVLLRNLQDNDIVITAGVGGGGAAMSANLRLADDFRAMSNMIFHAFFDSKIKPYNLRYKGYEWIYRGLAEYYVGNSIDFIPESVVSQYSITNSTSLSETYLRYLYFALKEPGFLAIGPADELAAVYIPQEEFYMGVKVPLIIDVINYSIGEKTGQSDGFIRELVNKGGSAKYLDVEKFLKSVCGADADPITDYLSGKALIPNIRNISLDGFPKGYLLFILDQDEQRYSYFFDQQKVFYPYMSLFLLSEDAFMSEVESMGISYNTDYIQNEVRAFSSVLHRLLLQRAMWASFAGIDDITRPNIIRELTADEVMQKWIDFRQAIGYEYSIDDYGDYDIAQ